MAKSRIKISMICCYMGCIKPKGAYEGSAEAITQAIELFRKSHLHGLTDKEASAVRLDGKDEAHIHFQGMDCLQARQRQERRERAAQQGAIAKKELHRNHGT